MVETWLWLRWQLWYAVPACWRTFRKLAPVVETEEGISRYVQGMRILRLALLWCISPGEAYRFRLYRAPDKALDYVYDRETQTYHAWRSRKLGFSPESRRLLQDKAQFHRLMSDHGIPVAPTLAKIPRYSIDPAPLLQALNKSARVFCKLNSGSHGRGAFTAWRTATGLVGRSFAGQPLADTEALLAAWRALLDLDDALIQPSLNNHPDLAPLAYNEEAITVRYISQWADQEREGECPVPMRLTCLNAVLEVPVDAPEKGHTYYVILPIHPERGELAAPIRPLAADPAVQRATARIAALGVELATLPGWARLIEASHRAHRLFPDVHAIAWDWVLTPESPVLLEGNTGWGLAVPQIAQGAGVLSIGDLIQMGEGQFD